VTLLPFADSIVHVQALQLRLLRDGELRDLQVVEALRAIDK
jgi:hypothetical protein